MESNIIHKVNAITGIVKRSCECLDSYMLRSLYYTSLICPHLDYVLIIWNPYQLGDIHLLEQVKRQVTRQVFQLKDLPYNERLRSLNLPSLFYRRHRMDMIMVYKITHGISGCPFENLFTIINYNVYKKRRSKIL